jgi:DNA-binding NarL/FixJ family response regulator
MHPTSYRPRTFVPPRRRSGRVGRSCRIGDLTRREHEVLELIAAGRTNTAIAEELVIGTAAVEKHVANIFMKLHLPDTGRDHRRVLAALWYVRATGGLSDSDLDAAC